MKYTQAKFVFLFCVCVCVCVYVCECVKFLSHVQLFATPWTHQEPIRLLCPWDSPGQITGVGNRSLLQGIFPTKGLNPGIEPRSPAL